MSEFKVAAPAFAISQLAGGVKGLEENINFLFQSHINCPKLGHLATPGCKGEGEMQSFAGQQSAWLKLESSTSKEGANDFCYKGGLMLRNLTQKVLGTVT